MRSSKQAPALICAIVVVAVMAHTAASQNSPDDYLKGHNAIRAAVGLLPVSWDGTVAAYAESYANERAGDCQLIHSGGPYGENIFWGSAGGEWTAQSAIDLWASEQQYYDYNSNRCALGQQCGHYTQMVWADSTSIGCARAVCDGGGVFITCNYNPPGNIIGQRPF